MNNSKFNLIAKTGMVKMLIELGANVNDIKYDNESALAIIAGNKFPDVVVKRKDARENERIFLLTK